MQKFRQNKKTIITVIIAVVIAVFISVGSCYVLAESLINSKDVVYEDNSNLVADNVQDAIDGTCSKIDTRLSDIEDKLYTVQNIGKSALINTDIEWSYSGLSVTFPAKSYCTVTFFAYWNGSSPVGIKAVDSSTNVNAPVIAVLEDTSRNNVILTKTYTSYFATEQTYYLWTKYHYPSSNSAGYFGFCATKYK